MLCVGTWPSSVLSRRRACTKWRNCLRLSPTRMTRAGCVPRHALSDGELCQPHRRYPDTDRWTREAAPRAGTTTQPPANVWPPSRALGRSSPRAIAATVTDPRHSAVAESSPPGLGWCRDRTQPEAKPASVELANAATVISGACSSTEPHGAALLEASQDRSLADRPCSTESPGLSPLSRWPIRWRASLGPS